jgi:hypothetical protein
MSGAFQAANRRPKWSVGFMLKRNVSTHDHQQMEALSVLGTKSIGENDIITDQ